MPQHIIGYFCGTGYYTYSDDCYQTVLRATRGKNVSVLAYDGCQVLGGGLFATGVEDTANQFINSIKKNPKFNKDENIQINLVGHSRGVISALLIIKKIQADPELSRICSITGDFRDPVPGNFQATAQVVGNLAIANQVRDLSNCDVLKKVHITLQELPLIPLAFDAVIPKFNLATQIEIETLPGYHDAQQRVKTVPNMDDPALFALGTAKTLSILAEDGQPIDNLPDLKKKQLDAYEDLIKWVKSRPKGFAERSLHFGGKITSNNRLKQAIEALNWRHASLKQHHPNSILYTTTHPHYNYRKNLLEHYCDFTQTLDEFLQKNPNKLSLVNLLKMSAYSIYDNEQTAEKFRDFCQAQLYQNSITDKNINKSINYMLLDYYLEPLSIVISKKIKPDNPLYESLQQLVVELYNQLAQEIESGKTIQQIQASATVRTANNTITFINKIYSPTINAAGIIQASDTYVKENNSWGRHWSLSAKIILGVIVCVAIAAVGCAIGAAIGFGIGLAILGPGAIVTTFVGAFIGAVETSIAATALITGILGLSAGILTANHFFNASKVERKVQELGAEVVESLALRS